MISPLDILRHCRPGETFLSSYRRLQQQSRDRHNEAMESNRLYLHQCQTAGCTDCKARKYRFDNHPVMRRLWHTAPPDNYVQLTCGHMVKTWSTKPVRRGQVVWCHLHNALGPARPAEIVVTRALVMWAKTTGYSGICNVFAPWPRVHVDDDIVMSEIPITIRE